ncbi:tryptophan 2-C-methyltransferase [Micromonospora sp. ATCC 39149]|uniref:Tryptophan 2-C-methyltransferase n=1 Tax=Micromonospora carbonacea TaxID=47853 RepID=A0A7D6CDG9_9ACTN|nr:tryptophan 2-C-methyltransferase [Micromonospora sp. ATCC 39149]QLJ99543.1 tryptophan 2-C-methyltransferase [Micromonospora carbonacea]
MSNGLVVLVNPNLVHPPIAPYALDVLTTSLEAAGFEVAVLDLTFHRDDVASVLRGYLTEHRPLLVGVTIRNTDTVYALERRPPFLVGHREIIEEIRRLTDAPLVVGGVGFSTMPHALVDYFNVEYGVRGPGEVVICELAAALRAGRPPSSVPGLLVNEGGGRVVRTPAPAGTPDGGSMVWQVNRVSPYVRRSGVPLRVDNLAYYRSGGLGSILTKNGCPYRCAHCVEPNAKGTSFAGRDTAAVVDEMEMLLAQGIHDLHTTDSEFNLNIAGSKNLLREIVRRKDADHGSPLHQLRLWVYCQPAPFDEEFAELLAAAGCAGINVGADHVRHDLLDSWKVTAGGRRYYRHEDTERLVKLCHKNDMLTMVEALFGMPGETPRTMRECVDEFLGLDATVTGFSLGLRLFPYIPLGASVAAQSAGVRTVPGVRANTGSGPILLKPLAECRDAVEYERQFVFDPAGEFRLLCYLSPDLPGGDGPQAGWEEALELLWSMVPAAELHRVMLPTIAGISEHDNNYADNPFLLDLVRQGYTGAFWAHWRDRAEIMRAGGAGVLVSAGGEGVGDDAW